MFEQKKDELLEIWLSIPRLEVEIKKKEVFQILEGDEQIDLKANEILNRTKHEAYVFVTEAELGRLFHSGFLDKLEKISRKGVDVKLITNDSEKSRFLIKETKFENVEFLLLDVDDLPFFLISDEEELLFLLRKNENRIFDNRAKKGKMAALWTNYNVLTKALCKLFLELWNSNLKVKVKTK